MTRTNTQRGFTLLELMLALSLTVIVLLVVNMAIDIHLRSLNSRRTQLEEAQLARSILRMIADDLRGTVLHHEQDTKEIEALLQQSVASAAQQIGQAAGGALEGATAGGTPTTSGDNNASGDRSGSSGATSGGGLGGAASGVSPSGGSANAASGSTGSSMSTGASSSSASSSSATGEPSQNTADLSTTTIPSLPGLFGNQYQLQIDISRLPRMENYQQYLSPDAVGTVMDVTSDVKTVTYYVQTNPVAAAGVPGSQPTQSLQDLMDPNLNSSGLVRRELDRSVTAWAMNNGNYTGLQNTGDVVAPEVAAIEFQYFDGTQWLLEWDTETQQKLPIAVLVILALRAPGKAPAPDVTLSELSPEDTANLHLYRMLVYLPAGGQSTETASSTGDVSGSEGSSATSSAASGTTGGAL